MKKNEKQIRLRQLIRKRVCACVGATNSQTIIRLVDHIENAIYVTLIGQLPLSDLRIDEVIARNLPKKG